MLNRTPSPLAVVLATASVLSPVAQAQQTSPLVLWYQQPAKSAMNEALPVGNGRLGGVVFGGMERERIQFNEISLWTGDDNPTGDYNKMGAYQAFGDLFLNLEAESVSLVSSPSGQTPYTAAEDVASSIDGNTATKWCIEHQGKPVIWQGVMPVGEAPVNSYNFTSANDVPERDPREWELAGSVDGQNWTVLDKRTAQPPFEKRFETKTFTFNNAIPYRYYRFTFPPNAGVTHFQLAEISLGGLRASAGRPVDDYRRELNLSSAIATTNFVRNGVRHEREVFASNPAQVMAVRWTAGKPGSVSGSIELKGAHGETTAASGTTLSFQGTLSNGMKYEAIARVLTRGGTTEIVGGQLRLKGCDEAVVLLAAGTDYVMDYARGYRGEDPHGRLSSRIEAASKKGFAALKAEHVKDFQALFGRTKADFGPSSPAQTALPTDERKLEAFKTVDPGLEALLFQYGRYLLISCSRPGGLPANLQGLWNDSNTPPWHSDYHANINIQMNYWPAEVANMAENHVPFFDLIKSQIPAWRKTTAAAPEFKTNTGAMSTRGFAIRTSHNITGGMGWNWDHTANAWYCQHLWEHYAFGQDKKYLRETAYPIIKETVEFWADHLKTLPDGRLVIPNGWSPEHGPHEDGVSYNQQIVWDLFTNYIEASEALNVDADFRRRVTEMRAKLVAPKIGKWGQLQEWMEDKDDPNDHHRHTSHLFAVFPGRQISVTKTPELARAAKISLDARGIDPGSDVREWSFAWRTALYARLHDGENAHKMVQQMFSARNTCSNMFGLHPPMQLDGNFGITAGIAEMLVQSHEGEINLLPALPAAWPNGSVQGLRARGGFEVDVTWANGKLAKAKITSRNGGKCTVRVGQQVIGLDTRTGRAYELDGNLKATQGR